MPSVASRGRRPPFSQPAAGEGLLARDLMRRRVATLAPDDTLRDAAELFLREGISGAPVLGPEGRVAGVISQTDLVRRGREFAEGKVPPFYLEGGELRMARPTAVLDLAPVREAMSPERISVEEDVPLHEVASLMETRGIHRVLVTRGGRLAGIISALDFVRLAAGEPPHPGRPGRARPRPRARSGRRPTSARRGR